MGGHQNRQNGGGKEKNLCFPEMNYIDGAN
jgi:hypothetical protein